MHPMHPQIAEHSYSEGEKNSIIIIVILIKRDKMLIITSIKILMVYSNGSYLVKPHAIFGIIILLLMRPYL